MQLKLQWPREMKIYFHTEISTLKFIEGLFIIERVYKLSKCSSIDEWIDKFWCVCIYTHTHTHTLEYYLAIKNLKHYNWKKPYINSMIPLPWTVQIGRSMETETRLLVGRSWGSGEAMQSDCLTSTAFLLRWWNVLELDCECIKYH